MPTRRGPVGAEWKAMTLDERKWRRMRGRPGFSRLLRCASLARRRALGSQELRSLALVWEVDLDDLEQLVGLLERREVAQP